MNLVEQRVIDFVAATASKEPTPGGGAIAALNWSNWCSISRNGSELNLW